MSTRESTPMRRKVIALPQETWDEIDQIRRRLGMGAEVEVVRLLLHEALTARATPLPPLFGNR